LPFQKCIQCYNLCLKAQVYSIVMYFVLVLLCFNTQQNKRKYYTILFFFFSFSLFSHETNMTRPNCAKFCHYMNYENSPCPSLTPTFLPLYICQRQILTLCGATDMVIMSFEGGRDGELRNHLLLIKDEQIRLIPRDPNSGKLNIIVVHLVGFNGFYASLRPKSQKRLEIIPPIPTEHDLSFLKSVKIETIF